MKHRYSKTCHPDHVSHVEDCRCGVCEGNLSSCYVCKGAEGSLPTECPGMSMTERQQDDVYKGALDFENNTWVIRP